MNLLETNLKLFAYSPVFSTDAIQHQLDQLKYQTKHDSFSVADGLDQYAKHNRLQQKQ